MGVLAERTEVIFWAHEKEDLARACELKREFPEATGVLASFGVLIPSSVLEVFEPEGILNIHPSLLPKYRGASPIESAILAGDTEFSVSVMKLAKAMDAGPIYYQRSFSDLSLDKAEIYRVLAEAGAEWICDHLRDLPEPVAQDEAGATFTTKMTKNMGLLTPETDTAEETLRKIVAFQGFPKPKFAFYGFPCTILGAHIAKVGETADLILPCREGDLVIERLQPEGRKAMDARSFANGYKR